MFVSNEFTNSNLNPGIQDINIRTLKCTRIKGDDVATLLNALLMHNGRTE